MPRGTKKQDYVGPFDGDSDDWMSRTTTDKGANLKTNMVPSSSKPDEAGDFDDKYSRSKMIDKKRNKDSMNKESPGFLKHTITGKC